MMTPYEFVQKHRVVLTLTGGDQAQDDNGWDHIAYNATLKAKGVGTFSLPYRCGMALDTPTASDLILTLATDQRIDTDGGYEQFALDFGYDTDSRRGEAVFEAVKKQQKRVARWLTPHQMADLDEVEES